MNRTTVVGIGNILLADDGVGVRAVEQLRDAERFSHADFFDAGTSTLDVLPILCESAHVIIIDALRGGRDPGTVYRLTPEQLGSAISSERFAHGVGVLELLAMAQHVGAAPRVVIFGVEPASIDWSLDLSPEVEEAMPRLLEAIVSELSS